MIWENNKEGASVLDRNASSGSFSEINELKTKVRVQIQIIIDRADRAAAEKSHAR